MRDMKAELGLSGDDFWPRVPIVKVSGDSSARPMTLANEEATIKSWQSIAVLEASVIKNFIIGFRVGDNMQFLRFSIKFTQAGRFGMRIGNEDVEFFIIPPLLLRPDNLYLELVTVTSIDDPNFAGLPVY